MTTNVVHMKPVVLQLDTAGFIDRCWELYGAGAGGSDFRSHQRKYFYRECRTLLRELAMFVFDSADPDKSSHILGDFDSVAREIIVDWVLQAEVEMDDDPVFKLCGMYMLNRFLRLLVRMGFFTVNLRHMSFITWSGNDMLIRCRFPR